MPVPSQRIYVQIDIASDIEKIWRLTQTPHLHQRWDLRFTQIEYLPRKNDSAPQRFLYTTRIGFGLNIRGEGQSLATYNGPAGERTSSLKFGSDDAKSLIRDGAGYWKYVPQNDGHGRTRFVTACDYDVRFGALGRIVDRFMFRPLLAWVTAWSFDRLRLWIEKQIDPSVSMRFSLVYAAARLALVIVWAYQGLVPKLLSRDRHELAMLRAAGFSPARADAGRVAIGVAEILLAFVLLIAWRSRWTLWLTLALMAVALIVVAATSPAALTGAFNPVSLNFAVAALAAIALLSGRDLASSSRCIRHEAREQEP